jgi:protein disulfide-isomerase A6
LVLLPASSDSDALPQPETSALAGLAEIADQYQKRKANMIPTYAVDPDNQAGARLRQDLGLNADVKLEIIAINVKRGWWRQYSDDSYDVLNLKGFIDAVKLGEGSKSKLPAGFAGSSQDPSEPGHETETEPGATAENDDDVADPEPGESPEPQEEGTHGPEENPPPAPAPEPTEADHDEL